MIPKRLVYQIIINSYFIQIRNATIKVQIMSIIVEGKIIDFIALIVILGSILYYIWKARQTGEAPFIRTIAGIEALDEAVGRSVEMNRPVHYSEGHPLAGKLYDVWQGPQYLAGLSVLAAVARLCAQKGARLVCSIGHSELLPLVQDSIKSQYLLEDKLDEYNPDNIYFFPEQSYTLGAVRTIEQEQVGANILFGTYWGQDTLMLPEAGVYAGAMQIGATAGIGTLPFFIAAMDYVLIGEELFVAGAIASGEPVQVSAIAGQDIGKIFAIILAIIGVLLTTIGMNWFSDLIKL
jgi:hypothetical protein